MTAASALDTFRTEANITTGDRWLGPLHPATVLLGREAIRNLARYRRAYVNYWPVTLARVGLRKYPLPGRLRRGGTVELTKHRVAQLYASDRIEPHPATDSVTIHYGSRRFEIAGGWSRGDIHGVYVEDVYGWLPVEGKTVVDVGASIGDSPLYFAARGSTRVIALEPWPSTYEYLVRNVTDNSLGGVVLPKNVALAAGRSGIRLDDRYEAVQHAQIREFTTGTDVPTTTLAELVEEHAIRDGILKLDCEGGEYDAILGSSPEVLRRFSHIEMEYHYGYRNLERALMNAGFHVRHTRPYRTVNRASARPVFWMGNLYAERAA